MQSISLAVAFMAAAASAQVSEITVSNDIVPTITKMPVTFTTVPFSTASINPIPTGEPVEMHRKPYWLFIPGFEEEMLVASVIASVSSLPIMRLKDTVQATSCFGWANLTRP